MDHNEGGAEAGGADTLGTGGKQRADVGEVGVRTERPEKTGANLIANGDEVDIDSVLGGVSAAVLEVVADLGDETYGCECVENVSGIGFHGCGELREGLLVSLIARLCLDLRGGI